MARAVSPGHGAPSDVLLCQIDRHVANLRVRRDAASLARAERVADGLRRLVRETARASAADRARVRAAVHCFVSGGVPARIRLGSGRYAMAPWLRVDPGRARHMPTEDLVVADLLRELGRGDLIVDPDLGTITA